MEKPIIAVFGATGRTGIPFLKLALEEYRVKALVRNPSKMIFNHPNLELIQGDILNAADVEKTIISAHAVVSLIGHVKDSPANLQSKATQLIIAAMDKHDVERLVSLTGGGVREPKVDTPKLMDKLVVFAMKNLAGKGARNALLDGISHAQIIKNSITRWTVVRGPMLTEEPAKNKTEVGNVGQVKGFKLTREDLAAFILEVIKNDSYIHQMPFITNGK
ncbi:MAG: nmra family protein [Bacteroidetes bacterium]|nr:MAG: nmra family protein [Bacteroidota bacterium]